MGKGATSSKAAELINQASALAGAGDLTAALARVDKILALAPRDPAALALKAALLTETDRAEQALVFFKRALAIAPRNAAALSNQGNALAKLRRHAEAIASYDRALTLNPDYALALCNRAGQKLELGQYEAALADVDRALELNPDLAAAQRNRSRILLALGRPDDALLSLDGALALKGGDAETRAHRGAILTALGRFEESLADYDQAVAYSNNDPENLYRRAHARLRVGDFKRGWRDHEARWRARTFLDASTGFMTDAARLRLDLYATPGELAGRTVLLIGEQGVGDQIMFMSVLADLTASAAAVTCICDSRMQALLARSFPTVRFLGQRMPQPIDLAGFDKVIALASLGAIYRNDLAAFPGKAYLRPSDAIVADWNARLGPKVRRRIGISWRGGLDLTAGGARSVALETLRPVLEREDCDFVSLQYGDVEAELNAFNATLTRPIRWFAADQIDDFEQLAGLVQNLDQVVSVQTALIHLCGALGQRCSVMVPFIPEWRYGAAGQTIAWYKSVRLFRQPRRGEWEPVVEAIGRAICSADSPPSDPDSDQICSEAAALARSGKLKEAMARLEALGEAAVGHPRANGLMGTLLTMSRQPEAAIPYFERSLELDALQPAVHTDLGNALSKLKRPKAATDAYDRALALAPNYIQALNNRAGERLTMKDGLGALEDSDRVIALNPKLPSAHRYRSRALLQLERPAEALPSIEQAMALDGDDPQNFAIRASARTALGEFVQGASDLDRAVEAEPEHANYRLSRAFARLRLGDFGGGWPDYEYRWKAESFRTASRGPTPLEFIPRLEVDNRLEDIAGRRVLLMGEQGVGDQMMFASLIPDLMRTAASVACVTSGRMQSLFAASFPDLESLDSAETVDLGRFDKIIPLGSLARLYRNALTDFPGAPYLQPREEMVAGWRDKLGPKTTRLRIGISWRGGAASTGASARSMSLEQLRPLLEREDCEFISLQYGKVEAEVEAFNGTLKRPIRVFPNEEISNFEALGGLVRALDLVVSVQTSIIHLAGALGTTCLVMIPIIPEWRYGAAGSTMPWYASVTLLRQERRGDWGPVIAAVGQWLDGDAGPVSRRPGPAEASAAYAAARELGEQGRYSEAVAALERVGDGLDADAAATALLGALHIRLGQNEAAVEHLTRALALDPSRVESHADLGRALSNLDRKDAALASLNAAIALAPNTVSARLQRALLRIEAKEPEPALRDLDHLMSLRPLPVLRCALQENRCKALTLMERFEEALAAIDASLLIEPENARLHFRRGRVLACLTRPDDARAALERAVAIDPSWDVVRYLVSMMQLRDGEFGSGWANYERRWKVSWFPVQSGAMVPQGFTSHLDLDNAPEDFDGKTVLVIAEQGVGDQIMFASVLPDLIARAKKITFVSTAKPMALFQSSFPTVDFIPPSPSLRRGAFDKIVAVGSLPYAFRRSREAFSGAPYLAPGPEIVSAWRERLGPSGGRLRVGISWRGGTDKTSGQKRSMELETLRPLLERDECEFINLQYGEVEAEVAAFNSTLPRPVVVFPKEDIDRFDQLAALVLNLDLVISVQTSLIHLCGALGAPCLVMIPSVAEWRYGSNGETMPWYNSIRLFRQTQAGNWSGVIARIGAQIDTAG